VALYNETLAGRFNLFIRKKHSMKGNAPAPQVGPELTHVLGTDVPLIDTADRVLAGWKSYYWQGTLAASANVGTVELRNPLGSNVFAVIERVQALIRGTAAEFLLDVRGNAAGIAGGTPGFSRDARVAAPGGVRGVSVCLVTSADNIADGSDLQFVYADVVSGVQSSFNPIKGIVDEWVLMPNDGWGLMKTAANNEQLNVSFWWRERALEDSETKV
jgi:hypothetical protein